MMKKLVENFSENRAISSNSQLGEVRYFRNVDYSAEVRRSAHERRFKRSGLYRFEHRVKTVLHYLKAGAEKLRDKYEEYLNENISSMDAEEEIIIQVLVKGGQVIEFNTGEYNFYLALEHLELALVYAKEEYARPLAWKFKGEEIYRSIKEYETKNFKEKLADIVLLKMK